MEKKSNTTLPRGIRNNNPLNLRSMTYRGDWWMGQTWRDKDGFCVFTSQYWGWRAALKNLQNYERRYHVVNLDKIIARWAPASDGNNPKAYTKKVAEYACIPETKVIRWCDWENYDLIKDVLMGMALVENGFANSGLLDEKALTSMLDDVLDYKPVNTF